MALLLRMGGVPARVAAGFTPGSLDSTTHRWLVTDFDAKLPQFDSKQKVTIQ